MISWFYVLDRAFLGGGKQLPSLIHISHPRSTALPGETARATPMRRWNPEKVPPRCWCRSPVGLAGLADPSRHTASPKTPNCARRDLQQSLDQPRTQAANTFRSSSRENATRQPFAMRFQPRASRPRSTSHAFEPRQINSLAMRIEVIVMKRVVCGPRSTSLDLILGEFQLPI